MPPAAQYYADFEFWSATRQLYWLPLHLVAAAPAEADAFLAPIRSGLIAHYRLIRDTPATRIVRGLRSGSVAEFQRKKLVGIANLLDAGLWTMSSARSPSRLDFASLPDSLENLVIDLSSLRLNTHTSVFTHSLPAKPTHLVLFNIITPGE